MTDSNRATSEFAVYYRHSLPVRIMHWFNAVMLTILLMSGLGIFNAHSALYWGESSYSGAQPLLVIYGSQNKEGRAKYVMRLEIVSDFSKIGLGRGGYWEDRGYEWYAGI